MDIKTNMMDKITIQKNDIGNSKTNRAIICKKIYILLLLPNEKCEGNL